MAFVIGRYFQNILLRRSDGKLILNSWTKYNVQDLQAEDDLPYTMKINDRLDKIAREKLGSEKYLWVLMMLNGLKHDWDWKIGDIIRIPRSVNRFLSYIKTNIDKN